MLYCLLLYTQSALQSCGGGGGGLSHLNHHQCAASTWMMRRLPQDNGASGQPAPGGRVIEPIKWIGLLGGHDWQGPVVGILPGRRYTPTLYKKFHGIFLLTTESQDLGLTSHPKDGGGIGISPRVSNWLETALPIRMGFTCLDLDVVSVCIWLKPHLEAS